MASPIFDLTHWQTSAAPQSSSYNRKKMGAGSQQNRSCHRQFELWKSVVTHGNPKPEGEAARGPLGSRVLEVASIDMKNQHRFQRFSF
jgi:hypothetical protein